MEGRRKVGDRRGSSPVRQPATGSSLTNRSRATANNLSISSTPTDSRLSSTRSRATASRLNRNRATGSSSPTGRRRAAGTVNPLDRPGAGTVSLGLSLVMGSPGAGTGTPASTASRRMARR